LGERAKGIVVVTGLRKGGMKKELRGLLGVYLKDGCVMSVDGEPKRDIGWPWEDTYADEG